VELALDEMERNADRRVAEGRGALPVFSRPKPPRKGHADSDRTACRAATAIRISKESRMKDAVATMGNVLPDDAGGRDAVHVAVFSAISANRLIPGQGVAVVEHGERDAKVSPAGEHVGIVDPFLRNSVTPGLRFWVYLYPRTITALAHRWSHPAFEAVATIYAPPSQKVASEQWLKDFCASADCPGYFAVLGAAERVADGGGNYYDHDPEYLHFNGSDAHGGIPPEFWDHVEVVLGRPIRGERAKYFSCSC
jgi:hypothetical protein